MTHDADTTGPVQQSVAVGPFVFDLAREELLKDGEPTALPPQPARMLTLLARHRGQIVTHAEARDAIWDDATVEFDQGLHTIVKQLRAALGDDARNPIYIQTIPRRGYRLLPDNEDRNEASQSHATHLSGWRRKPLVAASMFMLLAIALSLASIAPQKPELTLPDELDVLPSALSPYLEGLHNLDEHRPHEALVKLDEAWAIDPSAARILSARARAQFLLSAERPELLEVARRNAVTARDLDSTLIEPRMTLATLALNHDRSPDEARKIVAGVVQEAPHDIEARLLFAHILSALGLHSQAIEQTERAMAIDPLGTQTLVETAWVYFHAHRFDDALDFTRRALKIDPANPDGPWLLLACSEQVDDWPAAAEAYRLLFENARIPEHDRPLLNPANPQAFVKASHEFRIERIRARDGAPVSLAFSYALLGLNDQALASLNRAVKVDLCPYMPFIAIDPRWDPLREDERFERVLEASRMPAP